MSENLKREFFDNLALTWDSEIPGIIDDKVFLEWCDSLSIKSNSTIIDIGCGTGRLLPLLWEKMNREGNIYALDFSPMMISQAEKKCRDIPVKFSCALVQDLPFQDDFFDAIFVLSTFPHFGDKQKCLCEMYRTLKQNGMLWIVHLEGREILNNRHFEIGGAVKKDVLPDKNEMEELLTQANFGSFKVIDEKDRFIVSAYK